MKKKMLQNCDNRVGCIRNLAFDKIIDMLWELPYIFIIGAAGF